MDPTDAANATPAAAKARELAARAQKLAADIRALHQQWQETAGDSVRPSLFRADEAAGAVNHAAQELTATAADLDRIAAAGAAGICSIPWGVCPEHGATLAASGGQSWCTRCGQGWHYDRHGLPCTEPARWTWTDTEGATAEICDGHAIAVRTDLPGASLTPLTADAGGR